jgi:hypothetical protein
MYNLSLQNNQLEKQRIALEKMPIPKKISSLDINKLVDQVPISAHTASFLISLRELEKLSGVEVELFSDGSTAKMVSANELITSDGKSNLPNANYDTKPKATAAAGAKVEATGNNQTTTESPTANFAEQSWEISIIGTYTQFMDFIKRLADLPRFVSVKEWQFADVSTLTDTNSLLGQITVPAADLPANDINKKRFKLKLSIYSAVQYKDKFPDLPPVIVTDVPENRLDPTITDIQFNKLLETLNGKTAN